MSDPLDDIAFLARAPNRVRVLERLATGPCDRTELREATGTSRSTLGRTLNEFETRGWVVREGGRYRVTPLGELLADEVGSLVETVATMQQLQDIVRWLPTEELTFSLRQFADADVTIPSQQDPTGPVRRSVERIRSTDRFRLLANAVAFEGLEATWRATVERGQEATLVVTPTVLEFVSDRRSLADRLGEMLDTGSAELYRYEEPLPLVLFLFDEEVALGVHDEQGRPQALIETDDPEILAWAEETFESHRRAAEPLDPGSLVG